MLTYATTANGVWFHLLVLLQQYTASLMLLVLHNHRYYSMNKWGLSFCNTYHLVFLSQNHWCLLFREKHPLQQLHSKRGRAYLWGWEYYDTCLASKSSFVLIGLSGLPAWHEKTIGEFSKAVVIPHHNNSTLVPWMNINELNSQVLYPAALTSYEHLGVQLMLDEHKN